VPIGGTSAGLAILGEFSYAALEGSATTAEATANPFHENVTLEEIFALRHELKLTPGGYFERLAGTDRVVDGAGAARFNAYLGQILADFRRVML